jgi:hypothetical protein
MKEVGFVEVNAKKPWHDTSSQRPVGATAASTAAMQGMLPKALETGLRLEGSSVDSAAFDQVLEHLEL